MDNIYKLIANEDFAFDHVGIAVESLSASASFYEHMGFKGMHIETVPSEKVRVGMFELENRSKIELLEPTDDDSPVRKFLIKRGPGIHHICLRVKNLRQVLQKLKQGNVQLINNEPVPGAHNCLIAFVHPKATGGVLLELSEPQDKRSY